MSARIRNHLGDASWHVARALASLHEAARASRARRRLDIRFQACELDRVAQKLSSLLDDMDEDERRRGRQHPF